MTKRFIVESVIIDCLCEDEPRIAKVITDTDENYSYEELYEVAELLNEQQATIRKLQDLCGESDGENAKLRIENKKLKEMNEQLQKENKEMRHELDSLSGCYCADNKEFKEYWRIGYD